MTDARPDAFSEGWIAPLLEIGSGDPSPDVRLAALMAAAHFPLGRASWQGIVKAGLHILGTAPAGSALRREALAFAATVPLLSVREVLRGMAGDPDEPDREAVAAALAEAGDLAGIAGLLERAAAGDADAFRLLAATPLEIAGLSPQAIPPCPPAADEIAASRAFWRALAVGRLGDCQAIESMFAPESPVPPIFWGSPWVAYEAVAAIRPIPDRLRDALASLLSCLDDPEFAGRLGHDLARALRLTAWAATGVADAEGNPLPPPRPFGPVEAPEPFRSDRSVTSLLHEQIAGGRSEFDDGQIAWMIARTPTENLILDTVALVRDEPSLAARLRLLDILGKAADCQAGCAPTPFRGALAGGGAARPRPELIDDRTRMRMRPPRPPEAARPAPAAAAPPEIQGRAFSGPMAGAEPPSDDAMAGAAPPPPAAADEEERRVRARILHDKRPRTTFAAGAENVIRCWIGLPEDDQAATADGTIPRVDMPPEGLLLTAELCWGSQRDSNTLHLPAMRTARSGDCDLKISVPADERYVSAEIVFRYRGRIFEAVKVEAAALLPGETEGPRDALRLRVQYERRQVIALDDAAPCTATLVFGGNAASEASRLAGSPPTLRVYDGQGGRDYALKAPGKAIEALNSILFLTEKSLVRRRAAAPQAEAALDADDEEVRVLLRDMARLGAGLYNQLEQQGFADPGERIQFVGLEADAILPLEFVYDRGYPKDAARLCSGWKESLTGDALVCPTCGATPPDAETRRHAATICPLGFWSLRKVIERMDPASATGASAPQAGRRSLPPLDSAVFAASDKVPEEERAATFAAILASIADATLAHHWDEWYEAVKRHPRLLIALPHHDHGDVEDFLEIGDASLGPDKAHLGRGQILPAYVNPDAREPGPILLLLGCRTAAESELGYVQIVREFQKLRTSIVLGTLAQILGRHAAPLAREVVAQLLAADDAEADFGTLMRRVRRRMLAQGYLLALCLVALGDAEWRLTPTPPQAAPASPP